MTIRVRSSGHRRGAGLLGMLLILAVYPLASARADGLSADLQKRVRAATFEVVQLKPEEGDVTYERPLPMELIPYQQRVDKYRSIGTAFAVGPNRFVTAAHVMGVGAGSQFGPPALRDEAGEVYAIDQILKYSDSKDFVEFSLKHEPSKIKPLKTADPPPLNDPVYAVGNALGQGIVIRDGVYTSSTPEEVEGRWSWLRFTAAASPGNSGGPLVDKKGNVLGIVLRKSQSENLNYAVPIKLLTDSKDEGIIDSRLNFRLPMMDASETLNAHEIIPLPKSPADFYTAFMGISAALMARADVQITEHNKDRMFPQSATSTELLSEVLRAPFPRHIREAQDHRWVASIQKDVATAQLDHNGFIHHAGGTYELRAPDDVKLATLYSDSKLFMDLMLHSAYDVRRHIGTDSVRVTSLGKAREEYTKTDAYGRNWLFKIWAVPFDDAYLVTMNLPTPEGMVSLLALVPSSVKDLLAHQQEVMANFVLVTYEGTLPRWREFLDLKADQPQIFSKLSLDIDPGYQWVRFHSPRYELNLTPQIIGLTADSILSLNFAFFRDGGSVVWDVGGVAVGEGARHTNFIDVRRRVRPAADLPEGFQANWAKLVAGDFPFNGVATDGEGGKTISAGVPVPAGTAADQVNVRYVLTVHNEGSPAQDALHAKLEGMQKGFKALEH